MIMMRILISPIFGLDIEQTEFYKYNGRDGNWDGVIGKSLIKLRPLSDGTYSSLNASARDVKYIRQYVAKRNTNLQTLTLNQPVNIGDEAFYDCSNLRFIKINVENLNYLGTDCFRSTNLGKDDAYRASLVLWGTDAIRKLCGVQYMSIKANPMSDAHKVCIGSSSTGSDNPVIYEVGLKIPEGVESISQYAFTGIYMPSLDLPSTLTSIGDSAFTMDADENDSYNQYLATYPLTQIICRAATPPELQGYGMFRGRNSITTITVPAGSGDAYRAATGWSEFADKIVESTEF